MLRGFLELLTSMDLQQHVTSPTHQAGGTLDLVITFNDFDVDKLKVEPPGVVSGHILITCSLSVYRPTSPQFARQGCSWRNVDRVTLRQHIVHSLLCRPPPSTASTDELLQTFDTTLRSIADQLALERTMKCRLRPLYPWFDAECRANVTTVAVLNVFTDEREIRLTHVAASRDKHSTYYEKKSYWSERIKTDDRSPTKLWKLLNALLQRDKRTADDFTPICNDADAFLRFFDEKMKAVCAST